MDLPGFGPGSDGGFSSSKHNNKGRIKGLLEGIKYQPRVDGQNPAPPRMMIIPLFIGFYITISGGAGFLPSTVSTGWSSLHQFNSSETEGVFRAI